MYPISAGTLLAGKYRLESLVGRGGMGSVWRAEHLGLSAPVAVKLLDLMDFAQSSEALSRFHREARAAAAIRSPHVVQIFDHGIDETLRLPFIVMELLEGESLGSRLARGGPIGAADVARIFTQVARALSRAHDAGIVHRDLKPDNVFLVRNEDEEVAKVLDFGIAKAEGIGVSAATVTGAILGTAYYMSPEQITGKKVDFRADLWAFGVMAFECLTGKRPFESDSIPGLALRICSGPIPCPSNFAAVPVQVDEWFARIVNRDLAQCFPSAREAADALRLACTGEANAQRSSPPAESDAPVVAETPRPLTDAPLSRSANDLGKISGVKRSRLLPLLIASSAGVLAAGLAVSLRHLEATSNQQQPSASVAASVATAAPLVTIAAVPDACEPDSHQCNGTTPRICVDGRWANASVTAGQCGAVCSPESSPPRCNDGIPQTCDQAGNWRASEACSSAQECGAGKCVPKRSAPAAPVRVQALAPRPAVAKPDCNPSYTLDGEGRKHFKPECYR